MPMPRFRDPERLKFTVSTARTVRLSTTPAGPPLVPWPVAALGGGVFAALAGAVVVAGVVLVAWLSAIAIPLPKVLDFAAQVWLLGHGGVLTIGDVDVTLVPLGLTLLFGAICSSAGRFAYRQGRLGRTETPSGTVRTRLLLGSIGQVAAGYTVFAVVLAWVVAGPSQLWRPALGALALSVAGSAVGAGLAAGYRPWDLGPDWLRRAWRGAAAGLLGLVVVSAVTLATALVLGETRVAALEDALGFDAGGVFVWSVAVLAYLPNLLGWTLAWLFGGGFTVGSGSLVSLSTTELGMMPAVPVFGALPPVGAADPWLLAWLAAGVAVGALTGVVAVRRDDDGNGGGLVAGAAGGLAVGLVFLAWAAASRGALGVLRLSEVGPRLLESLAIGVPLVFISACLGAVVGLLAGRRSRAS
ncbi:MAG: DUF6350 family protein [Actinobacteria bacterium]|nr:DUF6350 family protein [Actinomycetota bacterium]